MRQATRDWSGGTRAGLGHQTGCTGCLAGLTARRQHRRSRSGRRQFRVLGMRRLRRRCGRDVLRLGYFGGAPSTWSTWWLLRWIAELRRDCLDRLLRGLRHQGRLLHRWCRHFRDLLHGWQHRWHQRRLLHGRWGHCRDLRHSRRHQWRLMRERWHQRRDLLHRWRHHRWHLLHRRRWH